MSKLLVLLRHGESVFNKENRFTGFLDVGLSEKGKEEARDAGTTLKGFSFDAIYCSALKRAIDTAKIALNVDDSKLICDEALNERHYGELQGKNKSEMRALYGNEQVHKWRRGFDIKPPGGESLKNTIERVLPYFKKEIEKRLDKGENILIVAHGNSLRALIKYLENISDEDIMKVEVPTGIPIVYMLDDENNIINKKTLEKPRLS